MLSATRFKSFTPLVTMPQPAKASPATLSHLVHFLSISPAPHPEDTLSKELVIWKRFELQQRKTHYQEALELASSKPFIPVDARKKLALVQALEEKNAQSIATIHQELNVLQRHAFHPLALESTLPEHKAKRTCSSALDWLNLETPRTRRLPHATSPLSQEQTQLISPQSHLELSCATIPTESRLSTALDWIKTPLKYLAKMEELFPQHTTVALPSETSVFVQRTYRGIALQEKEELGQGSYAKVRSVSFQGVEYARKQAKLLKYKAQEKLAAEASVHMSINSPYIVKLLAVASDGLYLKKESRGTLADRVKSHPLTRRELKIYLEDIVQALLHLHSRGYNYKDLKPENILLDDTGHAKLCDLGLTVNSHVDLECSGSILYRAPEVLCALHGIPISQAADSWSFGILLYTLYTGGYFLDLREGEPSEAYAHRVSKKFYMRPCTTSILFQCVDADHKRVIDSLEDSSHTLQRMIEGCLHGDPKKRLTMKQIQTLLSKYETSPKLSLVERVTSFVSGLWA